MKKQQTKSKPSKPQAAQVEMAKKAAASAAASKQKSNFKPSSEDDDAQELKWITPDSAVKRAVVSNLAGQPPPRLNPDFFYRLSEGPNYFGYKLTVLNEKIASGEIPMPVSLSKSGRAKGWFGRTIIAWQLALEEESKKTREAV